MKKLIAFSLIYFSFFSCSYKTFNPQINTDKCDSLLFGKKVKNIFVNTYEIDSIFYSYLDTIINKEQNYQFYNPCYSSFLYSKSVMQSSDTSNLEELFIGSMNKYKYDYSRCYGVFKYKNHLFICDSLCDKSLLHLVNKKTIICSLKLRKYLWQADIDDRYSSWYFIIKKNKVKLTEHYYPE
jgi:hypothetical protein